MTSDKQREREKLDDLDRIQFELTEQDTLILEQQKRSPYAAVPESQRALVRRLLEEVRRFGPRILVPVGRQRQPRQSTSRTQVRHGEGGLGKNAN